MITISKSSGYHQIITDSTFNRDSTFNFKIAHLIDRTVRLIVKTENPYTVRLLETVLVIETL